MELRLRDLPSHLERPLAPVYVVHGDEPLQAIEACDAIRAAARRQGYDEREVLVAEAGFKWDVFVAATANLGLFGDRKLIDLRIPSGKPGTDGARALEACAAHASADQMLLVTLPKIDRATQGSRGSRHWRARASQWRSTRSSARRCPRGSLPGLRASGSAPRPRRSRSWRIAAREPHRCAAGDREARPPAAEGEPRPRGVERAATDVARYDVFQLSEAWLAPDAGRALRIIAALEAEGEGIPLLLWQLGEDIHALAAVQEAIAAGNAVANAMRNARVWGKRQAAMERAARRVRPAALGPLLWALARLDALAKGIGRGNPWDELRSVAMMLMGVPVIR
jgi:DNA polymerase-3 subunit delta